MMLIRGNLLFMGIGVGIAIGLIAGWVVYPRESGLASPEGLRQDYKEIYMVMVAAAHRGNGDIERARLRLAALGVSDPLEAITALAQRSAAKGSNTFDVTVLAELALALSGDGIQTEHVLVPASLPTQEPGPTVLPETLDAKPTALPTTMLITEYKLIVNEPICNKSLDAPLLQVQVDDAYGHPLPGVRLTVEWSSGQDIFATGLYPEVGPGYANFEMIPGERYSLRVGSQTLAVRGLVSEQCRAGNGAVFDGSVFLRWQMEE